MGKCTDYITQVSGHLSKLTDCLTKREAKRAQLLKLADQLMELEEDLDGLRENTPEHARLKERIKAGEAALTGLEKELVAFQRDGVMNHREAVKKLAELAQYFAAKKENIKSLDQVKRLMATEARIIELKKLVFDDRTFEKLADLAL